MRLATVPLCGDPDQICNSIAAGIADEYLRRDPETRIRCDVSGGRGAIFVTGEILTQADFDVSHLISRLFGQLGVYEAMEPFVALEPVESQRIGHFRQACHEPVSVFGYATRETDLCMPAPVYWAKRIAQALEGRRKHDPDWFWLGPSGQISILGQGKNIQDVVLEIDYGQQPPDLVKAALAQEIEEQGLQAKIQINLVGESKGIEACVGHKASHLFSYGHNLPPLSNPAGLDWHSAEVYGAWQARRLALEVLDSVQSQAVMVEMLFMPGDVLPSKIMARDERGNDLSKKIINREKLTEWLVEWRNPGLMSELVKHGPVGSRALPWENSSLSTLPAGLLV
jgi:hypothetical protein